MRKTTGFNSIVNELAISNTIQDKKEVENLIIDWCNEIKQIVEQT